jgi:thiol-disulfide isomerase/thioredoxin
MADCAGFVWRTSLFLVLSVVTPLIAAEGSAVHGANLQPWRQAVPALALKDLQGRARSLQDWRGKVVVVHFWATWCEPCVAELPALMRLQDAMHAQPFEIVTVNLGESDQRIDSFYRQLGVDFLTLLDRDGDAKKSWRVDGVPMSFVLDAGGKARYRYFGEVDWNSADTRKKFAPLLRAAKRPLQTADAGG